MLSRLSSYARSSVIALVALASVPAAAPAAPLGPTIRPAVADIAIKPTLVEQGNGRDGGPGYEVWPRGRNWSGRNWDGRRNGRHAFRNHDYYGGDSRRHRRHYRHHYRPRAGVYLGLGLLNSYNYYDPYYNSVPVYRPRVYRRVHRNHGSTHIQWCYDRYRSYRAWDNTFKPYHGPRRLCYSPYS